MDTYFNTTDNNAVEEYNLNDKTHDSSKVVNSENYIGNGVDGRVAYDQLKELLIFYF